MEGTAIVVLEIVAVGIVEVVTGVAVHRKQSIVIQKQR